MQARAAAGRRAAAHPAPRIARATRGVRGAAARRTTTSWRARPDRAAPRALLDRRLHVGIAAALELRRHAARAAVDAECVARRRVPATARVLDGARVVEGAHRRV